MKLTGRKIEDLRVVQNGPGAAGTAIIRMLQLLGVKDIIAVDEKGILTVDRKDEYKKRLAECTNPRHIEGSLKDALCNADVFIGTSVANCLKPEMIAEMHPDPIIFACANPTPEIDPKAAKSAGAAIICTGRSDMPNQVNNVLVFPGIFRGALDARASQISEKMKLAAAYAIADVLSEDELNAEHILPTPFDPRVKEAVAEAVRKAAIEEKLNRI